jgi:Ser/Thr protein kinase RdoA (MazF antagonist)
MDAPDTALPITHSIVDANALGGAVQKYFRLPDPFRCELLTRGMNDVYLIRSAGTRYAARLWRAGLHSDDDVAFELDLLAHLKNAGVRVIAAHDPPGGQQRFFAVDAPEGRRLVCLFPWVPGRSFHTVASVEGARALGAEMARLHLAGASFKPRAPRPIGYHTNIRRKQPGLLARLGHRPRERDLFVAAAERICPAMEQAVAEVPGGALHGDIHVRNAFVAGDGTIHILDFDTCGEASYLHDLASFAWATLYIGRYSGIARLDDEINGAFVSGYQMVRPLTRSERDSWALFVAAKELSFITGMSYSVNVVGHSSTRTIGWDWFVQSVRRHVADAGLGQLYPRAPEREPLRGPLTSRRCRAG